MSEDVQGYCCRCRQRQPINNATQTRLKNGLPATTGTCAVCGVSVFKIGRCASVVPSAGTAAAAMEAD